jgi:hypothetical protein
VPDRPYITAKVLALSATSQGAIQTIDAAVFTRLPALFIRERFGWVKSQIAASDRYP